MNLRYAVLARHVLRTRRFTHVVSTGSQIAVPFLVQARLRGASCHYIESATRRSAPSLTGRVLARVPGIERYAQVSAWGDPPWHFRGTVFDGYVATPGPRRPIAAAAVAAGSSEVYGFRRLLEAAAAVLPDDVDVAWQTGSTPVDGLGVTARPGVPSDRLGAEFAAADVVIIHAGVGLALLALSAGRCPVVVPRRAERHEHVDDHQLEIAAELDRRGLAVACEPDDLTLEVLEEAAARTVARVASPPTFRLVDGNGRS